MPGETNMDEPKPMLIEITGQTQFHLGNPAGAIAADISMGYRKTYVKPPATENPSTGNEPVAAPLPVTSLYASVEASNNASITLERLITACTVTPVDIPDFLNAVGFKKFSILYGNGPAGASDLIIEFDSSITINDKVFEAALTVHYTKDDKGQARFAFGGTLQVDPHEFDLQFVKTTDAWFMFAGYRNQAGTTIDLRAIAAKLFPKGEAENMPPLSISIDNFKAFLLYKKSQAGSGLLFGMGAGLNLELKDLPLAGPILAQGKSFDFREVLAIYSTGEFTKDVLSAFKGLPQSEIKPGFNISTELVINGIPEYYVLNSGAGQKFPDKPVVPAGQTDIPVSEPAAPPAPLEGSASSKATWKKIDKNIGPVAIQRLGFLYKDGKVVILLDASMEMAGMGLQLMGFGLGFKLKWPPNMPDFYIDGIGISYNVPPIEISGAFLHSLQDFNGQQIHVYSGGAILKISWFTISAIGSYAKVKDDSTGKEVSSLFIYGVFAGPIGGPAFFFVTGIAAGFGYNRRVNVPSIEEVALFPLVALAMKPEKGGGLMDILKSLETPMKNGKRPIEISIGDYWLAIGIRFSSFKIIDSFVLVTVNFGTSLEFAILGLSRLSWPEQSIAPPGMGPIVYIELAILVHFGPASDVISVEAIITPNSYLFSKDCKLTGGFAFYTWVKGPHEGDFVVTLGGYHPKFRKPPYYPDVPRLGLNWKIGEFLLIKGGMYFALTSTAIMAGGKWEILFKTSVVSVSFILWADMLISWAPFEYYIDIGVILIIELHILVTLRIEFSAQLHIWGPPFAGEIYVNLTIFSFTIPFGDHTKKEPERLSWVQFSSGFVPQKKLAAVESRQANAAAKAAPASNPDPINISISNGLIDVKEINNEKFPVINPYQLAITIDSFIPVTILSILGINTTTKIEEGIPVPPDTIMKSAIGYTSTYDKRETNIGIRPCGFISENLIFNMTVATRLQGKLMTMSVTCMAKGIAEALWGGAPSDSNNANPGTSKVIKDVITGLLLSPPILPQVSTIREFDFSLIFDRTTVNFIWAFSPVSIGEAYHAYEVLGYYETGQKKPGILEISYSQVTHERESILTLLQTQFDDSLPGIQEVAMNGIMEEAADYFRAAPVICGIGQIPQYATDVNS